MATSWVELIETLAGESEEMTSEELRDLWILLGAKDQEAVWPCLADVDTVARAIEHANRARGDVLSNPSLRYLRNVLSHVSASYTSIPSASDQGDPAVVIEQVRTILADAGANRGWVVPGSGKSGLFVSFLARELSPDETLSAAAELASHHPGLADEPRAIVRAVLATLAHRGRLTEDVAGGPRRISGADDLADSLLRQARIAGEAIGTIWEQEMLEASAVAVALGAKPSNREKVRVYRDRSWLLGLPHGRGYVYPAFQFDARSKDLFAEVKETNQVLGAANDPWGVASWWVSINDWLGDRPIDAVRTDRAPEIVKASRALLQPIG